MAGEHERELVDHLGRPFVDDGRFTHFRWGDPLRRNHMAFSVFDDGVEVARMRLDEHGFGNADYVGAPRLGPGSRGLLVDRLEVAEGLKDGRIGTWTVGELAAHLPDRRLVALAGPNALRFWSRLGWDRYDHREGPQRGGWPLFVQPLRR